MSEDPFGSTRRRPAPPRLRLSNAPRPSRSPANEHSDPYSKLPLSAKSEPGASSPGLSERSFGFASSNYTLNPPRSRTPQDEDVSVFSQHPTPPASRYSPRKMMTGSEVESTHATESLIDDSEQQRQASSNPSYLHIPPVPPLPPTLLSSMKTLYCLHPKACLHHTKLLSLLKFYCNGSNNYFKPSHTKYILLASWATPY
ncbi:hypothetical protein Pst134EB_006285 [Puccinia striiformis f. sp. tritici]|nr:hypothetical protein Pst134EB_006285 [Puccinia striiformis f. sp. tritici]